MKMPAVAKKAAPDGVDAVERHAGTHYAALDGVRGLAILLVLLLHFTLFVPRGAAEGALHAVLSAGWIGVDLFFVISGFLITGILCDTRDDPHYFRNFYARRSLRIFPLYYAYLFLLFIVLPMLVESYALEHATDDRRIWLWTYLGNVQMGLHGWEGMPSHTTHLWSLAIEEQFYLIWPIAVLATRSHRMIALCSVTFMISVVTRLFLVDAGHAGAAYLLTPARMDGLAAGALLAVVLRQFGPTVARRLSRYGSLAGGAMIGVACAISLSRPDPGLLEPLDPVTQTLGYPGLALLFAGGIGLLITGPSTGRAQGVLRTPFLLTLGRYSYAAYLIHVPLRNGVQLLLAEHGGLPTLGGSQLPAQIVLTAVGIAVTLAVSALSWHLFEKRVLRMKRHFEPERRPAQSKEPAPA